MRFPAQIGIAAPLALAIIVTAAGSGCSGASNASTETAPDVGIPDPQHIVVDQFGYRPGDTKVAVIRNPQAGYDSDDAFSPGRQYEIRRLADDAVVFSGSPMAWNEGATEPSSGDQGWWFDFSALEAPGRYVVVDVESNSRSPPFDIAPDVYRRVLKAAMRTYFYQRSGFAKQPPYAEKCWADGAAYLGPQQDSQAHDVTDRANASKQRDMRGGWFDAGDTTKYVTFAVQPVHQLLTAYTQHPAAFTDDFNIPESGNGIPDVIDEVRWETDWLARMQFADGSVALKIGATEYRTASPPSSDKGARFYVPACTSATIAAAGMYAHASWVYSRFTSLQSVASDLKSRAVHAWSNYHSVASKQEHCDTGAVLGGNADWNLQDQNAAAVEAAIYLAAITGESSYHEYVKAHFRETRPYRDFGWSRYQPDQGEALLFYTTVPGASPDVVQDILAAKTADARVSHQVYGFSAEDDLYRAFLHNEQYHWGSNNPRANYGNTNLDAAIFAQDAGTRRSYELRAEEILHYFHGVNPFGLVYLTNMHALGSTHSANEIFHTWFQPNTRWSDAQTSACGPPPGYVPGGPNASAEASGVPARLSPPAGQPPQKSYRDWNANWPENSWAVTEPAIYYQAAYVKLLAAFADPSGDAAASSTVK